MILKCLGSSSDGNCYLLKNDAECLVIENGISFKEVKRALDFNILQIVGTIASHRHGDHFKYSKEYKNAGITTFYPFEEDENKVSKKIVRIGGFSIQCFPLIHDVPCYGFYIRHDEMGKLIFATDTECIRQVFKKQNVNHMLLECNYQDELVDKNAPNYEHKLRHHMSLSTLKEFLIRSGTNAIRTVILCHMGAETTIAEECLVEVQNVVGEGVDVVVAHKGLEVELSKYPF